MNDTIKRTANMFALMGLVSIRAVHQPSFNVRARVQPQVLTICNLFLSQQLRSFALLADLRPDGKPEITPFPRRRQATAPCALSFVLTRLAVIYATIAPQPQFASRMIKHLATTEV
jgi:hypothetical protein